MLELLGCHVASFFISTLTFGIMLAWGRCIVLGYVAQHTVINGRRLKFIGRPLNLFSIYIKDFLLCVITVGIYSFWVAINMKRWEVENTVFE
jgi:uncharacterized membrane protein YjgN (DUF898 family)